MKNVLDQTKPGHATPNETATKEATFDYIVSWLFAVLVAVRPFYCPTAAVVTGLAWWRWVDGCVPPAMMTFICPGGEIDWFSATFPVWHISTPFLRATQTTMVHYYPTPRCVSLGIGFCQFTPFHYTRTHTTRRRRRFLWISGGRRMDKSRLGGKCQHEFM